MLSQKIQRSQAIIAKWKGGKVKREGKDQVKECVCFHQKSEINSKAIPIKQNISRDKGVYGRLAEELELEGKLPIA